MLSNNNELSELNFVMYICVMNEASRRAGAQSVSKKLEEMMIKIKRNVWY